MTSSTSSPTPSSSPQQLYHRATGHNPHFNFKSDRDHQLQHEQQNQHNITQASLTNLFIHNSGFMSTNKNSSFDGNSHHSPTSMGYYNSSTETLQPTNSNTLGNTRQHNHRRGKSAISLSIPAFTSLSSLCDDRMSSPGPSPITTTTTSSLSSPCPSPVKFEQRVRSSLLQLSPSPDETKPLTRQQQYQRQKEQPLKRSKGLLNLDEATFNAPRALRRSSRLKKALDTNNWLKPNDPVDPLDMANGNSTRHNSNADKSSHPHTRLKTGHKRHNISPIVNHVAQFNGVYISQSQSNPNADIDDNLFNDYMSSPLNKGPPNKKPIFSSTPPKIPNLPSSDSIDIGNSPFSMSTPQSQAKFKLSKRTESQQSQIMFQSPTKPNFQSPTKMHHHSSSLPTSRTPFPQFLKPLQTSHNNNSNNTNSSSDSGGTQLLPPLPPPTPRRSSNIEPGILLSRTSPSPHKELRYHNLFTPLPSVSYHESLSMGDDTNTEIDTHKLMAPPDGYQSVKPLQTAFMSSGLLSKKEAFGRRPGELAYFTTPETPCKRANILQHASNSADNNNHNNNNLPKSPPFFKSSMEQEDDPIRHIQNQTQQLPPPLQPYRGRFALSKSRPGGLRDSRGRFSFENAALYEGNSQNGNHNNNNHNNNNGNNNGDTDVMDFTDAETDQDAEEDFNMDNDNDQDYGFPATPTKKPFIDHSNGFGTLVSSFHMPNNINNNRAKAKRVISDASTITPASRSRIASLGSISVASGSEGGGNTSINTLPPQTPDLTPRSHQGFDDDNDSSGFSNSMNESLLLHSDDFSNASSLVAGGSSSSGGQTVPHTPAKAFRGFNNFTPGGYSMLESVGGENNHNNIHQYPFGSSMSSFSFSSVSKLKPGSASIPNSASDGSSSVIDTSLMEKFNNVSFIGRGEFSNVFAVSEKTLPIDSMGQVLEEQPARYAVKRTRYPYLSSKTRLRQLEELAILDALTKSRTDDNDDGKDYIVNLIDAWETSNHLYIMTEYCENGSLDVFLSENGRVCRLDEWRVWKILIEITLGIKYIHNEGYLHLDIKPANVFITFEGTLKIGDFGMATPFPAPAGIEREGDREYIAPEILSCQDYNKPADVFSLGLMMLEIAANIVLPDNGVHWQKLRSGDLSDAGRLSSGDLSLLSAPSSASTSASSVNNNIHGNNNNNNNNNNNQGKNPFLVPQQFAPFNPPPTTSSSSMSRGSMMTSSSYSSTHTSGTSNTTHNTVTGNQHNNLGGRGVPSWAPEFMINNAGALDTMVQWMLSPDPQTRPTAQKILDAPESIYVDQYRRAGAVVYEGDFGPNPNEKIRQEGRFNSGRFVAGGRGLRHTTSQESVSSDFATGEDGMIMDREEEPNWRMQI